MNKFFSKYFRKPEGIIGYFISNKMKKMNEIVYQRIDDHSKIIDNMHIFEIGFGPGYGLNFFLNKYNVNYHGIDFSKQMYNRSLKLMRNNFPENNGQLFFGDFLQFENDDLKIDLVFFANVTYFWDELKTPFKKIYSLLNNCGNLIFYMSGRSRLENKKHTSTEHFNHHNDIYVLNTLMKCGFKNVKSSFLEENSTDRLIFRAEK